MKLRFFRSPGKLIALILFLLALVLLLLEAWGPLRFKPESMKRRARQETRFHDYRGVVHVHSKWSDGMLSIPEIADAARAMDMDFLVVTDHNTLAGKNAGEEGVRDGLLLLVGNEISNDDGHYLALGIPDTLYRLGDDARSAVFDVDELGGLGIVAHPDNPKDPWRELDLPGIRALEVGNGDSAWRNRKWYALLRAAFDYSLNPSYAVLKVLGETPDCTDIWDRLNRRRHVAGIAGADAHGGIPFGKRALRFPSYRETFRAFVNHILTEEPFNGNFQHDEKVLLDALRAGRSYMSVEPLGDPTGFYFQASSGDSTAVQGGDLAGGEARIEAGIGQDSRPSYSIEISLFRDGRSVMSTRENKLVYTATDPGVYRVDVYRRDSALTAFMKQIPWIRSNPIRFALGGESGGKPVSPYESSCRPAGIIVQDLQEEGSTEPFRAEQDVRSKTGLERVSCEGSTAATSGCLCFSFALGVPDKNQKDVYCALGDRTKRELSSCSGICFSVRGDRIYRMEFQLRDEDPRGGAEKAECWSKTFKICPEWHNVNIPFADLKCASTGPTNRVLEPENTASYFFILHKGVVRPGTEGKIWFDNIGFY